MSRVSDAPAQQQGSHHSPVPQSVKVENTHGAFGQTTAQGGPASHEAGVIAPAPVLRMVSGQTPQTSGPSTPAANTPLPPSTAAFSEPASRTPSYHGHTNGHVNAEAGPSRLPDRVKEEESGEVVKDEKDDQVMEEDQALVKEAMRRKRRFAALQYGPEETAEMERRAVRNGLALALDQHATLFPSPPTRFASYEDAVDRLLPWHVWQIHDEELEGYLPDEAGDTPEENARIRQQNEAKEKARVDKETADAASLVHRIIGVRNRFVKVRRKEGFHASKLPSLIQITQASNSLAREELIQVGTKLRETREAHNRIDTENRRRQEAVRQAQMRETLRIEEEKRRLAALSKPPAPPLSITPASAGSTPKPVLPTGPIPARPPPDGGTPRPAESSSTPGPAPKPAPATAAAAPTNSAAKPSPTAAPASAPALAQPSPATPAKPAAPPTPASSVASPATPLTPGTPTAQRGRPRGRPRGTGRGGLREATLTHTALAAAGSATAPAASSTSISAVSTPSKVATPSVNASVSASAGSTPAGGSTTGPAKPGQQTPASSAPTAPGKSAPSTPSVPPQIAKPPAQAVQATSTPTPGAAAAGSTTLNGTPGQAKAPATAAAGPPANQAGLAVTPGPVKPAPGRITLTVSYENAHQLLKLGVLAKQHAPGQPWQPAPGIVTKVIAPERKMVLSIDLKQCTQTQVVGMAKIMNVQLPSVAGQAGQAGTPKTSASPATAAGNAASSSAPGSSASGAKNA